MTGRERVNRAMSGQDQDRVPFTETVWPQTFQRWAGEGGPADYATLVGRLDSDFHPTITWIIPKPLGADHQEVVSEDEQTRLVRDPFGATLRIWKARAGTPEHHGWECDSPEIWKSKFRPALESVAPDFDRGRCVASAAEGARSGRWRNASTLEPFEFLRKLLGDEATMIALAEEPEWVREISEVSTTVTLAHCQALLDAGVELDGLWVYGDMAFKTGTFCSPTMYREIVWPQHRRFAEWAHARGLKAIYHTDGDVRRVVGDFIEAGFDSLQPLEAKASMDIRELAPQIGSRISLFGNMDVMVYAFGSEDDIRAEVESKMAAGKATGRYIFHSDHSIPPQVSWDRYQFILSLYRQLAAY